MSRSDEHATAAESARTSWGVVAGTCLITTGVAAYEIVPASVTPVVRESLRIGPTAAGLLVGVMFGMAVVTSFPGGVVLDRTSSRTVIAGAVCTILLAGVWGWIAGVHGDYWSIIASRALGGAAYVVVWNASIDVVSQAAAPESRAIAVGIFTASGPVGFALGQGTGPLVAARFGWPAIFPAFTGIAAVGLLVFWPLSRGVERGGTDAPPLGELASLLRDRTVWLVSAIAFLSYALYLFVNSWGSSYLTDEMGLSLALSGLLVAVFPAVGVVSRISGGVLSDRLCDGRRRPVLLGSFLLSAPLLLVFTRLQSIPVLVVVLLLAGFAIQLTLGLSFTYVREVTDPRVAATAVSFLTSVGLAGAFLAPIAGGVVIDAAGFDSAFLLAGALAVGGIAVAWRAPEPAERSA